MAYSFTSASSMYLSVASAPVAALPLTMSAWVYVFEATTPGKRVMALTVSGTNDRHVLTMIGNFQVTTQASGVSTSALASFPTSPANRWVHVAGIFESTSSRIAYIEGTSASNTSSNSSITPNLFQIGASLQTGVVSAAMNGYIAESAIWDVALNSSEINALAKGYKPSLIRPNKLQFYSPLIRELIDTRKGVSITNNNSATVIQHPRIYG